MGLQVAGLEAFGFRYKSEALGPRESAAAYPTSATIFILGDGVTLLHQPIHRLHRHNTLASPCPRSLYLSISHTLKRPPEGFQRKAASCAATANQPKLGKERRRGLPFRGGYTCDSLLTRTVCHTNPSHGLTSQYLLMALVSGPGRGGGLSTGSTSQEIELAIEKHVEYILKLDTVRARVSDGSAYLMTLTEERRARLLADGAPTTQRGVLGADCPASSWPSRSPASRRDHRLCSFVSK